MVELKSTSFIPMMIYLKNKGLAECTGISFVDSTPLRVCDKRRHERLANWRSNWAT